MKEPFPESCCSIDLTPDEESRLIEMSQAIGNPLRFEIIKFLYTHPGCITGDIVDILPIAQSTTSQHLKVLKNAGLICGSIEGTSTNYCLNMENLAWFKSTLNRSFNTEPCGDDE